MSISNEIIKTGNNAQIEFENNIMLSPKGFCDVPNARSISSIPIYIDMENGNTKDFLDNVNKMTVIADHLQHMMLSFYGEKYQLNGTVYDGGIEFRELCEKHNCMQYYHELKKEASKFWRSFTLSSLTAKTSQEEMELKVKSQKNFTASLFDSNSETKLNKDRSILISDAIEKINKEKVELDELKYNEPIHKNAKGKKSFDKKVEKHQERINDIESRINFLNSQEENNVNNFQQMFFKTFFPIKTVNGIDVEDFLKNSNNTNNGIGACITQMVMINLTQFNTTDHEVKEKKNAWQIMINQNLEKYSLISKFIDEFSKASYFKKFSKENFKRFYSSFEEYDYSNLIVQIENMAENKIDSLNLSGYISDKEIRSIMLKYKDLFINKDSVFFKEYKNIMDSFHLSKDYVNISSIGNNGNNCKVFLGENFIKETDMKVYNSCDGMFSFSFYFSGRKCTIKTHRNNRLQNLVISPVYNDANTLKKYTFKFSFSSDSKRQKIYEGFLKEPSIRVKNDSIFIDLCMTKVKCISHYAQNIDMIDNDGDLIKSPRSRISRFYSAYDSKKIGYKYETIGMGLDVGMANTGAFQTSKVKYENGEFVCEDLCSGVIRKNNNFELVKNILDENKKLFFNFKRLLNHIKRHYVEFGNFDNIAEYYTHNKRLYKPFADVGLNFETTKSNLQQLPIPYAGCPHIMAFWWRHKDSKELLKDIKSIMKKISDRFSDMKNMVNTLSKYLYNKESYKDLTEEEYLNAKEFAADANTYRKIELTKLYIDIMNVTGLSKYTPEETNSLISGIGLEDLEKAIKNRPSLCCDLWKYYNGLKRFVKTYVGGAIVSTANKHNVSIIMLEDLDNSTDSYNNKKKQDRVFKSIWSQGEMGNFLKYKAAKHNIAVVPVNPNLTSQVDNQSLCMGERTKENPRVLKIKTGETDADINASKNILLQGVSNHTFIHEFKAEYIDENNYQLVLNCLDVKNAPATNTPITTPPVTEENKQNGIDSLESVSSKNKEDNNDNTEKLQSQKILTGFFQKVGIDLRKNKAKFKLNEDKTFNINLESVKVNKRNEEKVDTDNVVKKNYCYLTMLNLNGSLKLVRIMNCGGKKHEDRQIKRVEYEYCQQPPPKGGGLWC